MPLLLTHHLRKIRPLHHLVLLIKEMLLHSHKVMVAALHNAKVLLHRVTVVAMVVTLHKVDMVADILLKVTLLKGLTVGTLHSQDMACLHSKWAATLSKCLNSVGVDSVLVPV